MVKRVAVLLMLGILICCGYAHAGWYKLSWGMTIDEIRAALRENVVPITTEDKEPRLTEDYELREYAYRNGKFPIGRYFFDVFLAFDQKGKLEEVALLREGKLEDTDKCFLKVEEDLTKTYGPARIRDDNARAYGRRAYKREWIISDTRIELVKSARLQTKFLDIWAVTVLYISRLPIEEKR